MSLSQNVASEVRSLATGAQEPQRISQYVRIPSIAGMRDDERSSCGEGS